MIDAPPPRQSLAEKKQRRKQERIASGLGHYMEVPKPIFAALTCMGLAVQANEAAYVLKQGDVVEPKRYYRCSSTIPYQGRRRPLADDQTRVTNVKGEKKNTSSVTIPKDLVYHVITVGAGYWNEANVAVLSTRFDERSRATLDYLNYARYVSQNVLSGRGFGPTFAAYSSIFPYGPALQRMLGVSRQFKIFDDYLTEMITVEGDVSLLARPVQYPWQIEDNYLRTLNRLTSLALDIDVEDILRTLWDEYYSSLSDKVRVTIGTRQFDLFYQKHQINIYAAVNSRDTDESPIITRDFDLHSQDLDNAEDIMRDIEREELVSRLDNLFDDQAIGNNASEDDETDDNDDGRDGESSSDTPNAHEIESVASKISFDSFVADMDDD